MGKISSNTIGGILQRKSEIVLQIHKGLLKKQGGINELNGSFAD